MEEIPPVLPGCRSLMHIFDLVFVLLAHQVRETKTQNQIESSHLKSLTGATHKTIQIQIPQEITNANGLKAEEEAPPADRSKYCVHLRHTLLNAFTIIAQGLPHFPNML